MGYFDLVKELRDGSPDVMKAAKAMKILGWICVFAAVWNYVLYYLGNFGKEPFNLPPDYPDVALISLLVLGVLFLLAAHGVTAMELWGKQLGQFAVVLLVGMIISSVLITFSMKEFSQFWKDARVIVLIFSTIIVAQFVIPAYFGMRYLRRLPVNEDGSARQRTVCRETPAVQSEGFGKDRFGQDMKYRDSPMRFGIYVTFLLWIAVPLFVIMMIMEFMGPEAMAMTFPPFFLIMFFGPIIYNRFQSPFETERGRILVSSYTGGGSIYLFNGSWPFFRLLVYKDGVEIRIMFQRYFIPYDKMDDIPDKIGFFSGGMLFKSNLPGVPSSIRFYKLGMNKIAKVINEARAEYLSKK
jgi:hypothetical protein